MSPVATLVSLVYTLIVHSTATRIREYYFETTATTWSGAKQICHDKYNTSLATILTQGDLNAAIYTIPTIIGHYITRAWIGLNDIQQEGVWEWDDNTQCTFDNATGGHACSDFWYSEEPNDWETGEDCGELRYRSNIWSFNDATCEDEKGFICNKPYEYTYVFNGTFLNWTDAQHNCNKYHNGLATIKTTKDLMNAINTIPPGVDQIWIGLNDRQEEGVWTWSNGDGCTKNPKNISMNISHHCSTFWSPNEPNNWDNGEDCGEMWFVRETGTWLFNDQDCDWRIASLCIESNTAHPTPQPTPDIENAHFALSLTLRTWAESWEYCEQYYYGLASLLSENELQEAVALLPNNQDVMAVRTAWIGLNDIQQEGVWEWVDGSECTVNTDNCTELWDKGEPNNAHEKGENCGQIRWISSIPAWKINDKMCDYPLPTLCSKNETTINPTSDPTPSPTTKPTSFPTKKPTWKPTPRPTNKPTAFPSISKIANNTNNEKGNNESSSGVSTLDVVLIGIILLLVIALGSTLFCLIKFKQMYKRVDEMSQYVGHGNAGISNDDRDVRLVGDDAQMATTIN